MQAQLKIADRDLNIKIPDNTELFAMTAPEKLTDPAAAIEYALIHSLATCSLEDLIKAKIAIKQDARVVIVISDNTRPVPYKGDNGILWPIIKKLLDCQIPKEHILILVANGTHRALRDDELKEMLDIRIFEAGISIQNHNCRDRNNLIYLGKTAHGTKIFINRFYMEADIKILTGLVESHFMAGFSGGRKSVCPGLVGEETTYIFHGASFLSSPKACDLNLIGNPCHDEALEVAEKAGVDYIVNVTLDCEFNLTGVFAGDLKLAHECAIAKIKSYTSIPLKKEYDIVITHAGFVGINHYQAAKVAVAMIPALKPGGYLIELANNVDINPVGSPNYRTIIHLLKILGPEKFNQLLFSPDWRFIPDQWQVQMWSKLFQKISPEKFIYYSPQLSMNDYGILPGIDGNLFLPDEERYHGTINTIPQVIDYIFEKVMADFRSSLQRTPTVAFFMDGPYAVPVNVDSLESNILLYGTKE